LAAICFRTAASAPILIPLPKVFLLNVEELEEEFLFAFKLSEQKKSWLPIWPHARIIFKKTPFKAQNDAAGVYGSTGQTAV
jgi:hypothetical protein